MSDHVPKEIVMDILSRLPVKSLLRFRCVSTQWLDLIDDPHFIKSHLKLSIKTNSNQTLILTQGKNIHSLDLDSKLDYARQLNHPFKHNDPLIIVLGSSNGILCLRDIGRSLADTILFWNPTTGNLHQTKLLPKIQHNGIDVQKGDLDFHFFIYGFGYDHVNDDYKLIRIGQLNWKNGESAHSDIEIYSLISKSWRRIVRHFPYYFCDMKCYDTLVSGYLHWVARRKRLNDNVHFIAAFDLATEEFRLVPQFDHLNEFYVGVLGGCLSVYNNSWGKFDIWVMRSYGVKESWTKLVSIAQPVGFPSFKSLRVVTYSKTGDKLLLQRDNNAFVWYDLGNKTFKKVEVCGLPQFFNVNTCMGSFVQIDVGGSNGNQPRWLEWENKKKSFARRKDASGI